MSDRDIQSFLGELPKMKEDLPFSPVVLNTLFAQTGGDSMVSLERLGETMSQDQGLTTRLLSLANSAYYGLQAEVTSVKRAAAVLGLGEIRNMILALGVRGLIDRHKLPEDFELKKYWRHQFLVGLMAREISRTFDVGNPETMFTSGMLHDIGKLITAMKRPQDWAAIQELVEDGQPESEAEDDYWGIDHAVVGALVLKSWDLPADLVEPVNWHHAPALAPDHSAQAGVICLADMAIRALDDPDSNFRDKIDKMCPEMDMDPEEIIEMAEEVMDSEDIGHFLNMIAV